jgi:DNA-binding IclR family transcriptional regulator
MMKPTIGAECAEMEIPADLSRRQQMPAGKYGNTSMLKCFEILETLGGSREPLNLAAIRSATGLNKTTAFRLLQVLKDMGYVVRTEAGYELGYRLYRLTLNMSGSASMRRLANPFLVRLAAEVGETVHLGILEQSKVVHIDEIHAARSLSVKSAHGLRPDAHATALGKVLLAYQPSHVLRQLYAGTEMRTYTSRTITDLAQLERLLKQVRTQGFAVDNEESELGLRSVAAPVSAGQGEVTCAVSISGPTARITDAAFPNLVAELQRCTHAIEASMVERRTQARSRRQRSARLHDIPMQDSPLQHNKAAVEQVTDHG